MKVASIGECMVQLSRAAGDALVRGFGGDTLNTALYLSRLGVEVSYVTALGDDVLSQEMISAWCAEGIDVQCVLRLPKRLPGLYMIERDVNGERNFLYWRDRAAAREYFDHVDTTTLDRLATFDWLYLSGISLSLYGDEGRGRLVTLLAALRRNGGRVAFDGNYRPAGWTDVQTARGAYEAVLPYVDLALPTLDDEKALFGSADVDECARRLRDAGVREVVIKQGASGCVVYDDAGSLHVAPDEIVAPVDTTAAGDSFNAGYLAARIFGAGVLEAARAGNRLAGSVIRWPGAIIPNDAMPTVLLTGGLMA
jgi:2-dehydro-3-deoxygluconokinase